MPVSKLDQSLQDGKHAALNAITGNWEGTASTYFEPPKVEDASPVTGTIKPVLGGRFVMHEYTSAFKGDPTSGIMIIGYHIGFDQYQCAWVDSFHMSTGILFSESAATQEHFAALGHYKAPGYPDTWGWRTEIIQPSANELLIRAYNISPDGEEALATEINYKRTNA